MGKNGALVSLYAVLNTKIKISSFANILFRHFLNLKVDDCIFQNYLKFTFSLSHSLLPPCFLPHLLPSPQSCSEVSWTQEKVLFRTARLVLLTVI